MNTLSPSQLLILRDQAYKTAKEKGFLNNPITEEHHLVLIATELLEAVQADRRARTTKIELKILQEIETTDEFRYSFERDIKDTIEDELADFFIHLLTFSGILEHEPKITDIDIVRGVVPQTLPSFVYRSIRLLTHSFRSSDIDFLLTYTYAFAQSKGIDIEAHIALKMRYNKTRGCCNAKKF